MRSARSHQTRNFLCAQIAKAQDSLPPRKALQVRLLRGAEHLHSFLGEITVEPGEREAGPIDGRFPDLAMKTDALAFQLQLQLLRVRLVKTFDGDNRNVLPLIAPGRDRLG